EHGLEPEREHGLEPEREHGLEPEREHGLEPEREHGLEPEREHGLEPEREHELDGLEQPQQESHVDGELEPEDVMVAVFGSNESSTADTDSFVEEMSEPERTNEEPLDDPADDPEPAGMGAALYPECRSTKLQCAIILAECSARLGLSRAETSDWLRASECLLPPGTTSFKSSYDLWRHFPRPRISQKFIYCSECSNELEEGLACQSCDATTKIDFMVFDIRQQLRAVLQSNVHECITFPIDCTADGSHSSMANSTMYRSLIDRFGRERLERKTDLTYSLSMDAFPLFSTSPFSITPVYLTINEMPRDLQLTNSVLVGLWYGNGKKANCNLFLPKVIDALNSIAEVGFIVVREGIEQRMYMHPLKFLMDAPQRADALKLQQL
ncbi:hypothetical protein BOX15_Mlig029937g6, partial [Macrostomum lignano]